MARDSNPCQYYDNIFNCVVGQTISKFKRFYSNIQIKPERLMKKTNINSKFTFISAIENATNAKVDLFVKTVSKDAVEKGQVDDIIKENCNGLFLNQIDDPMFMQYITSFASYTINKYYDISTGMTDDEELIINQMTPEMVGYNHPVKNIQHIKYIQKNETFVSIYKKVIGHPLSECLNYLDYTLMLFALNTFLEKYIYFGYKYGILHNDLHLDNIYLCYSPITFYRIVLIDYGRMIISSTDYTHQVYHNIYTENARNIPLTQEEKRKKEALRQSQKDKQYQEDRFKREQEEERKKEALRQSQKDKQYQEERFKREQEEERKKEESKRKAKEDNVSNYKKYLIDKLSQLETYNRNAIALIFHPDKIPIDMRNSETKTIANGLFAITQTLNNDNFQEFKKNLAATISTLQKGGGKGYPTILLDFITLSFNVFAELNRRNIIPFEIIQILSDIIIFQYDHYGQIVKMCSPSGPFNKFTYTADIIYNVKNRIAIQNVHASLKQFMLIVSEAFFCMACFLKYISHEFGIELCNVPLQGFEATQNTHYFYKSFQYINNIEIFSYFFETILKTYPLDIILLFTKQQSSQMPQPQPPPVNVPEPMSVSMGGGANPVHEKPPKFKNLKNPNMNIQNSISFSNSLSKTKRIKLINKYSNAEYFIICKKKIQEIKTRKEMLLECKKMKPYNKH